MKPRLPSIRSGASLKFRQGNGNSVRSRHMWNKRCKMAAATEVMEPRPGTSEESPGLASIALSAEEGVCVLLLSPAQKMSFTGKCILTCLYGSVQVLGFTINSNDSPYELFSPNTHAPLTIEALKQKKSNKSRKEIRMEARALLRGYLSLDCRRTVMKSFKCSSSILLLERLDDPSTNFIGTHAEYASLFRAKSGEKYSSLLDDAVLHSAGIQNRDPDSGINLPETAVSAAQELVGACVEEHNGCPVILVCGPQNVGKSTFNRYLINRLLNHMPCVGYLECDLGQSEFTPPGCISLINVTKPVLGPPFTHQREVHKMVYFGEPSCEQEIERFLESVKYVITCYKREQPLIINTMGWIKGFGLLLLIDLIHLLSPSHIVQMVAEGSDCMEALTPEYIKNTAGFMTKGWSGAQFRNKGLEFDEDGDCMDGFHFRASLDHQLFQISSSFSGAGSSETVRCHGWILRDLAMLGYISKLQQFDLEQIIPLNSLLPYEVPFNAVALRVIHADVAPSHIMFSANASWVGLCHILDDVSSQDSGPVILTQTPICDCLGFGIIRGINMMKKVYHILTPVPPEALRLVNCLLIGNISIPHSVFKHQSGIKGDIPYITSEYDFSIYGSGKQRSNTKPLKRREHLQAPPLLTFH
ncbi:polynucleotide 5'-hydroxyl-kinase NOL9 [Hyperolius riggenbachi]|uniref:polynucleotide 5'-hydroxyl-kinase NOL9 n=1 Tax=Hyperolius riggenbachi TaxID=752182 RepID=UPI0035A35831